MMNNEPPAVPVSPVSKSVMTAGSLLSDAAACDTADAATSDAAAWP